MSNNLHKFKDSTSCAHCDYDDKTGSLMIKFLSSDKEHWYPDVPKSIYEGLKTAASPGKFFHTHIRKQYKAK